jgi:hypothetical protein
MNHSTVTDVSHVSMPYAIHSESTASVPIGLKDADPGLNNIRNLLVGLPPWR